VGGGVGLDKVDASLTAIAAGGTAVGISVAEGSSWQAANSISAAAQRVSRRSVRMTKLCHRQGSRQAAGPRAYGSSMPLGVKQNGGSPPALKESPT